MPVKKELLDLIVCPKCKGRVSLNRMFITCGKCKLAFPVLNDSVPDLLIEDAWPVEKARKSSFRHKEKL